MYVMTHTGALLCPSFKISIAWQISLQNKVLCAKIIPYPISPPSSSSSSSSSSCSSSSKVIQSSFINVPAQQHNGQVQN
jgi:hypothetical protein